MKRVFRRLGLWLLWLWTFIPRSYLLPHWEKFVTFKVYAFDENGFPVESEHCMDSILARRFIRAWMKKNEARIHGMMGPEWRGKTLRFFRVQILTVSYGYQ